MRVFFLLISLGLLYPVSNSLASQQVNIYSSQKEHLIRPVLEKFEQKTGIKVNLTTGKKSELVSRLVWEGKNTPADLLLTADIGNIYQAKLKGVLQPIESTILNAHIPAYLRDTDSLWFGLMVRARTIFYHKDFVTPESVTNYKDLADPKWKGKLLIRSSSNVYNQSLTAFMLHQHGYEETLAWAKGIVANMARPPQGGDTDQLRALAAGEGHLAVANTYYYGRLLSGDTSIQDQAVQEKVGIILPNQQSQGMHINIRGGGVTKYATNKKQAIALLEFLTDQSIQAAWATENFEYPVVDNAGTHPMVSSWMDAKQYTANLEEISKLQTKAIEIMDKAGWK